MRHKKREPPGERNTRPPDSPRPRKPRGDIYNTTSRAVVDRKPVFVLSGYEACYSLDFRLAFISTPTISRRSISVTINVATSTTAGERI